MTRRNFYIVALWLPLIWPVLISLVELFLHHFMWHQMSRLSGMILISGLFGGIQYLMFAAAISYYFARKDMTEARRVSWILPAAFAGVCSVGLWMFFSMLTMRASQTQVRTIDAAPPFDITGLCVDVAIFSLLVGYAYVMLIHALLYLLEKFEYLED